MDGKFGLGAPTADQVGFNRRRGLLQICTRVPKAGGWGYRRYNTPWGKTSHSLHWCLLQLCKRVEEQIYWVDLRTFLVNIKSSIVFTVAIRYFLDLHVHAPTLAHFKAVKRILWYVSGTLDLGLNIFHLSSLTLSADTDADWAGCSVTQRSTTGFCTFLGSILIFWSAKKQPTVAQSSMEAEYRAMASTIAKLSWLSFILRDIGVTQSLPSVLYCDNFNALHMTINPVLHARMKPH
ncbi:hypothetical protein NE237_020670 [Protea cynaroides]|uniref:Uncharacterized protein n=1 Tax=Protea cynaroides TaxID=273540 RepID=A0A9Q0H9T8_9MAGN|nr:hypothetical protein NE237_020670 [Protea cynaroides]